MVKEIADILQLADKSENWKINLFKLNVTKKEGIKYFVEELKSDNVQMKTETKTIELQKQDGKWKVVANNELANSLLPGLQESVDAIQ